MRWLHSLTFLFTVLSFAACGPRNARVAPALPHQHAGADLYRHAGRRGARRQ